MSPITISGLHDLPRAVEALLPHIRRHRIIAFYGKMGVGKTTLIKELCIQMGVNDVVSSPTFSLVNEYETESNGRIFHFDFYRINSIDEAYDFGYEEYFYSGNYCLIEWPEKIEPLLPRDTLCIRIEENIDKTRLVFLSSLS